MYKQDPSKKFHIFLSLDIVWFKNKISLLCFSLVAISNCAFIVILSELIVLIQLIVYHNIWVYQCCNTICIIAFRNCIGKYILSGGFWILIGLKSSKVEKIFSYFYIFHYKRLFKQVCSWRSVAWVFGEDPANQNAWIKHDETGLNHGKYINFSILHSTPVSRGLWHLDSLL